MCCSVNRSVCLVCCVFVNCLAKQFAICLGVVAILLLNVMECRQHKHNNQSYDTSKSCSLAISTNTILKVLKPIHEEHWSQIILAKCDKTSSI